MKKISTSAIIIIAAVFLSLTSKIYGASDTLTVFANGPSLDMVIGSDTTATGVQAHKAYKLVSLDTTYIFLGPIVPKSDISIVGVLGKNGRPPCIQPGILSDGSIPTNFINMIKAGTVGRFENLYIFELSTASTFNPGVTFDIAADNVKIYMNNIIDDESHYLVMWYSGNWDSFFITNCKFRNGVNPTDWYASQVLSPNLYLPITPADTVVMTNNTFFCMNGATGGSSYANYVDFSHNSVVYSFIGGGAPGVYGSGKINNNMFYGLFCGGESASEFTWMDDPYFPQPASNISFDTLSIANAKLFDPADSAKSNFRLLAEAKRKVEVKNNAYFMPKKITDFWKTWNDTAHIDSLYTPSWMNDRTAGMFKNKTTWPGFTESGNILNVDPGFGSSFDNIITGGGVYGVGMLKYIVEVRRGTVTTEEWGYKKQTVTGATWVPNWPLPEAAEMKYSNTAMKTGATDGKPIGDQYWFTGLVGVEAGSTYIPVQYSLGNNYPNPFNPSTTISYSVPKAGYVTLKVFNILGKEVATLYQGNQNAGSFKVNFDASKLSSGVYIYRLQAGDFCASKKMTLIK